MNTIQLTLTIEQINTVLRCLDSAPHGQVRQLIDLIINEATRQQQGQQNQQNLEGVE